MHCNAPNGSWEHVPSYLPVQSDALADAGTDGAIARAHVDSDGRAQCFANHVAQRGAHGGGGADGGAFDLADAQPNRHQSLVYGRPKRELRRSVRALRGDVRGGGVLAGLDARVQRRDGVRLVEP